MDKVTLAVYYKRMFDSMCGLDDHNFKRTKHQLIAGSIEIEVVKDGAYLYTLKDDSKLRLTTKGELKTEVVA